MNQPSSAALVASLAVTDDYVPEFPCPEDEHVDVDETGFCRGCGLTTDVPEWAEED